MACSWPEDPCVGAEAPTGKVVSRKLGCEVVRTLSVWPGVWGRPEARRQSSSGWTLRPARRLRLRKITEEMCDQIPIYRRVVLAEMW